MRIRVKFARAARVKYLGHLDIMRAFQRGFIRAGVRMIYSEGFSPHQKMNFAQPLGVGILSTGDYFDAEIADGQDLTVIKENLNEQMGEGFGIISVRALKEGAAKAMAAVEFASYEVKVICGDVPGLEPFIQSSEILATKKTKSGESVIDIKPLVKKIEEKGNIFTFTAKGGSENNLKPDLLMQELYRLSSIPYDRNNIQITRTELLAGGYIPLENFQTE